MEWSNKISSFLLIFLILNSTHFSLIANGRQEPKFVEVNKRGDQEEKMMRGLIGSRPPRCERVRCRSCSHCEAIQVPTNPQKNLHSSPSTSSSSSEIMNLDYIRGDDSTNYKPMSWKCKCGNSIYNP